MKRYWLIAVLFVAILAACNTPTPTVILPEDDPSTTQIIDGTAADVTNLDTTAVSSKAVVLDAALLAAIVKIDRSSGEVIFDEAKLPLGLLATGGKLEVGNTIVARGTPKLRRGLLRKITQVTRENGFVRVKTVQGKLNEVFTAGGFRVQRKMKLADAKYIILPNGRKQALQQQTGVRPQALGFPVQINFCPVNIDGNTATKNDQVCVSGSVDISLEFMFVFKCEGFLCTNPFLDTNVKVIQTTNLTVTGELSRTIDKRIPLGTVPLPIIVIPVGFVPLTFVPEIDLEASLTGQVSVNFNWSANQRMEFTAGMALENGAFRTYDRFTNDIDTSGIDVSINMNAEARVEAEASILVFGIGGPTVTAGLFVTFEAGFPRTPTWSLDAGFDVSIGLEIDMFGLIQADVKEEIFEKRFQLAEAPNIKPTVIIQSPLEGDEIELAVNTDAVGIPSAGIPAGTKYIKLPKADIKTDDAEDGERCCTVVWEFGNNGNGATTNPGPHMLEDRRINGGLNGVAKQQTITVTATDSSGGKTTKTWNYKYKECQNYVTFAATGLRSCATPMDPKSFEAFGPRTLQ